MKMYLSSIKNTGVKNFKIHHVHYFLNRLIKCPFFTYCRLMSTGRRSYLSDTSFLSKAQGTNIQSPHRRRCHRRLRSNMGLDHTDLSEDKITSNACRCKDIAVSLDRNTNQSGAESN